MRNQLCLGVLAMCLGVGWAAAGDWYQWRGPEQNGVSREKNLPVTWSAHGENLLWTAKIGGMSSPIVMGGRLYTMTRVGEELLESRREDGEVLRTLVAGPRTQEAVVCLDAGTGQTTWEHRLNMTQTEVPFHRLGWSNVVGDPQTGRVYALGAQCWLVCLDGRDGKLVWQRQMTEEFGMISTFGGRTPSPALDEDQVLIGGVSFGWGDHARGQHRLYAFNKNTGELNWASGTGGLPVDAPYNTPVIAVIGGQRLAILGAGDGGVHAFQARTGRKVWSFQASKRGLNASVVVDGTRVYICHSEENMGGSTVGAVICIDVADGTPREVWRKEGIESGFASPTIFGGRLYVADNKCTVQAIDAMTGDVKWKRNCGTIGKASLVYADGKLYVPEANGRMNILKPGDTSAQVLSRVTVEEKLGREYAIFGSVAISSGRIYLQCANSIYCIGTKDHQVSEDPIPPMPAEEPVKADTPVAHIVVTPADAVVRSGGKVKFAARAFDAVGRPLGEIKPAWSVGKLALPTTAPGAEPVMIGNLGGTVGGDGEFVADDARVHQGGAVVASHNGVKGASRVRVMPPLPWKFDFENSALDRPPLTFLGAGGKFWVKQLGDTRTLCKVPEVDLYYRARTNFGSPDMSNYTVQADVRVGAKQAGEIRHMPDPGIISSRYVLVLLGTHQKLQIHVWPSALAGDDNPVGASQTTVPFRWEPDKWYRLKLFVSYTDTTATAHGKAWPADQPEPKGWTVLLTDPIPNRSGNPGLYGHSLVTPIKSEIWYDNILVTGNEP